jgi:hypothetical protein
LIAAGFEHIRQLMQIETSHRTVHMETAVLCQQSEGGFFLQDAGLQNPSTKGASNLKACLYDSVDRSWPNSQLGFFSARLFNANFNRV